METALFVFVHLIGVPFAAGIIGEKNGKGDWAFALIIALMSWVGVGLFLGIMLMMYLAVQIYRISMKLSERLDDLNW